MHIKSAICDGKIHSLSEMRRQTSSANTAVRKPLRSPNISATHMAEITCLPISFEYPFEEGYFLLSFYVFQRRQTAGYSARVAYCV